MSALNPPRRLGAHGRRLWRAVIADVAAGWQLDGRDLELLEAAAAATDRVAELEEAVKRDGLMIAGSKGQDRLHPAVAEARMQRQHVAALLAKVEIAPPGEKTGRLSKRQRDQLKDARQERWNWARG